MKPDALLDQLSTSQQNGRTAIAGNVSEALQSDIEFELEQSHALQARRCENGAPFIFFVDGAGRPRVVQGCCNNWLCKRCGQIRARHEYGRIVHGSQVLHDAGHDLYFVTITCRGREISAEQADADYLKWTNRLLTSMRRDMRGAAWAYAQVTERQQKTRPHPHSHFITTYEPADAVPTMRVKNGVPRQVIISTRFDLLNERAGLGPQHEITLIDNPTAVAVYVSKYLFKDSISTVWPRGWRRVRYSRSWPKLPVEKPEIAYPLIKISDWHRMAAEYNTVFADSEVTYEAALARRIDVVVYQRDGAFA